MLELEEMIAVWTLRELKQKRRRRRRRRRKMCVNLMVCDRRNNGLVWTAFEDLRRDEAKFLILECR
jgi:hypothetical protein